MKQFFILLITILSFSACSNDNHSTDAHKDVDSAKVTSNDDHSEDIAAIKKADEEWSKASEAKSAGGWLSFYHEDAIMMPPNERICTDKASRETSIKNMFAVPGMSLVFQTTKVEVSNAGDMAYAVGVYQWASKDPKGNDYHETGKYSEIWKKQSDGNWKCIVDIWNADPAAAK